MQESSQEEPVHYVQWFYLSNYDLYDETSSMELTGAQSWRRFLNYDNNALEAKYNEIITEEVSQEPNQKNVTNFLIYM